MKICIPKLKNGDYLLIAVFCTLFLFAGFNKAEAANLSFSPNSGMLIVDSTFEISVFLDTQGEEINTIAAEIKFPPDKLQIVSPSTGQSIIEVWLSPPKFNNQTGTIELKGGIPGGIKTSRGLITKLLFRTKSIGLVFIKFLDQSKILLNDGLGTDALFSTQNAVFNIVLPPPAGPIVVSPSHPDQSQWYSNPNLILNWVEETSAEEYSYILNDEITDLPDDVSEGRRDGIVYKNLAEGRHYFHIKAMRAGLWGGVTHFAINIDITPPAEFPIKIIPSPRTTRTQPVIEFQTSDTLSGIDHYELKIIAVNKPAENSNNGNNSDTQPFFIEATSPFVFPESGLGSYDIIARVYDKANNYRDVVERLDIVTTVFKFITNAGVEIKGFLFIPWPWIWIAGGLIILSLISLMWYLRRRHYQLEHGSPKKVLPDHIKDGLRELQKYREKYGKIAVVFLVLGITLLFGHRVFAQEISLSPPFITTVSKNLSNEEIFYIGGKTEAANTEVVLYIQNLQTGETISRTVVSDKKGDWFYRHDNFFLSGNYLLWAQSRIGQEASPPGPQISVTVRTTAIQFGASRISYEVLYLIIIIAMAVCFVGLITYITFHGYRLRRKRKAAMKEIKEAEEAVRIGFAVLRRDIQAELAVIKRTKMNKDLSAEEKEKEEQLLKDLEDVEKSIGKEVFDIEKAEYVE